MRILMFIDSLGSGGAQRQLVTLSLGLVSVGHQVEFAVYHPEATFFLHALSEAHIPVHCLKRKWRTPTYLIHSLRKLWSARAFDVVLSFLDAPNLYAELARAGRKSPRLVVSERNSYQKEKPTLVKYMLDSLHKSADAVTVNTYWQADRLLKAIPVLGSKTHVIYNGLDVDVFRPNQDLTEPVDSFLSVGSVIPRKNIRSLIGALAIHRDRYGYAPTISWAGSVYRTQESVDEYARAQDLLQQLRLTDSWTWLGEQSNMPAVYNRFTSFIHPSLREGLPNALCEAMASEMAPLVSGVGENLRIVQEGVTGLCFDPTSPENIAEVIHRYLTMSGELRKVIALNARQFAQDNFSMQVCMKKYETLFYSLL